MAIKELRMELTAARRLASQAFAAEMEGDIEARTQALSHLIANETPTCVAEMAFCFGRALPSERALAAHALRQLYEVAPSDEVVQQILDMLDSESDATVVAPLLTALSWTRQSEVLGEVLAYQRDGSALVRHAVSDALPMFAPDSRAAAALAELANDDDNDVRWSAVFELGSWLLEIADDRIVTVLAKVAVDDPDELIRAQAVEGLAGAVDRPDVGSFVDCGASPQSVPVVL